MIREPRRSTRRSAPASRSLPIVAAVGPAHGRPSQVAIPSSEARQRAHNRSIPRRPQASHQPALLVRTQPDQLEHQRLHVLGPAAGQTTGQGREFLQEDVEVAGRRSEVAEPLQLRCHPGDQGGRQEVAEQLDRRATPPDSDPEVVQELDVDVPHGAVPSELQLVEEGHQHPGHRHAGGQPGLDHRPGRVGTGSRGDQRRRVADTVVTDQPGPVRDPAGARTDRGVPPQRDQPQPAGQPAVVPIDRGRTFVDEPQHGLALGVEQPAGDRRARCLHHRQQRTYAEDRLEARPQLVGKAGHQARPTEGVGPDGDGRAVRAAELETVFFAVRARRDHQRHPAAVQPEIGAVQPHPVRGDRSAHGHRVDSRQRRQGGRHRRRFRGGPELSAARVTHRRSNPITDLGRVRGLFRSHRATGVRRAEGGPKRAPSGPVTACHRAVRDQRVRAVAACSRAPTSSRHVGGGGAVAAGD